MSFDLTGQTISDTYGQLVQHISGSLYDGLGNQINIDTSGSLPTSSLATTGSNIFKGNQTISGSLYTSGSVVISGSLILNNIVYPNYDGKKGDILITNGSGSLNWDKGFTWSDYIFGKLSSINITVIGGKVQEFSYSGTTEKRYRFISNPYSSSLDIIYTTFSSGSLSNPIAYRLITL